MQTRFNGNIVSFAEEATSTNRTIFGGTTQSDNIDDNLNADFKKGWEIVGVNDNPTREDFNAMGFTLGSLTSYLYEMGISEWNEFQKHRINSRVLGSDGKIYKSLTGTILSPNVGNNPVSDSINWKWELKELNDYSQYTAKTTPVDADLLSISDSSGSFGIKKLSWANLKSALKTYFDTLYVSLTGNQTIAGLKTFSGGFISTSDTQGIGYGLGAGGSVTQLTSKVTPVTLNKPTGRITMNNSALPAGVSANFVLNNSLINSTDLVYCQALTSATLYRVEVYSVSSGACSISVKNEAGVSLSDALPLVFCIIKGATA